MENLREDAERFKDSFKKDASKSTIRKTGAERKARKVAYKFPELVEKMLKHFKSKREVSASLPAVRQNYRRLDELMGKIEPSGKTRESWSKMKQELEQINKSFNFEPTT